MTVSTQQIDTNTKKIISIGEVSSASTISAVDSAITSMGWTRVAYNSGFVPGSPSVTSSYSTLRFYIYKAINADALTYKYFIIYWDVVKQNFWTATCEDYNTTTNVITNQSWTSNGSFINRYDIRDGSIIIGATNKHIFIWPFVTGNRPGMWAMVCEFERMGQEDTAFADGSSNGPCCWAWTCSLIIGGTAYTTTSVTASRTHFCFPRIMSYTGTDAAFWYTPVVGGHQLPTTWSTPSPTGISTPTLVTTATGPITQTLSNLAAIVSGSFGIKYAWASNNPTAWPISADMLFQYLRPIGNIFNVGVTDINAAGHGELFNLKTDATGGWPYQSGNDTNMIALNMVYSTVPTYLGAYTGFAGNSYSGKFINIGNDIFYMACSDGVRVWNSQLSGSWPASNSQTATVAELIYSDTGGVTDIIFDGERTVWAAGSTGIIKIDTETGSITTGASTGGIAYVALDGQNVYATQRNLLAFPKVNVYPRSATNLNTFGLINSANWSYNDPVYWQTPVPDHAGNVYLTNSSSGLTVTTNHIEKYDITSLTPGNTVTQSGYLSDPVRVAGAVTTQAAQMWLDPTDPTGRVWMISINGSSNVKVGTFLPAFTATVQKPAVTAISAGTNNTSLLWDNGSTGGELNLIPFQGQFLFATRKLGSATSNASAFIVFEHPANAGAAYLVSQTTTAFGSGGYASGWLGSDGNIILGTLTSATNYVANVAIDHFVNKWTNNLETMISKLLVKS
jgi:hypothetical protein